MKAPLRVLVADDESPARRRLLRFLAEAPDLEVVGEAANGLEAVEALERLRPDLLFLDVQMPELDGFGVIREVGLAALPATIFVTAYDHYALPAFDAHAVDYLLKPFDQARLDRALERARQRLAAGALARGLEEALREIGRQARPADRLLVRSGERRHLLPLAELQWVEAENNHVRLHAVSGSYLMRETMRAMEARLDPARFRRIHRSSIVNLDHVTQLQPWFGGDYLVLMKDGSKLTLSRTYKERVRDLF